MSKNNISVIINTLNESANIKNCLESVKWADEIILVDMYSDDDTVEIAKNYTDKIFHHERVGYADPARQFALEQVTNEWVLMIDADEMITARLYNELLSISSKNDHDAVWVPRENYFFGDKVNNTGWGPIADKQLRFFKREFINYTDKVHHFVNVDIRAQQLSIEDPSCAIVHFCYLDTEHFIEKLNRYTTIEALQKYKNKSENGVGYVILLMLKEFARRYISYKGYKDGVEGFYLSIFMMFYKASTEFKLYLLNKYDTDNLKVSVYKEYANKAEEILNQFNRNT